MTDYTDGKVFFTLEGLMSRFTDHLLFVSNMSGRPTAGRSASRRFHIAWSITG